MSTNNLGTIVGFVRYDVHDAGQTGLHAHRTTGRDRNHRDLGRSSISGVRARKRCREAHCVFVQHEANRLRAHHVSRRKRRPHAGSARSEGRALIQTVGVLAPE